MNLYLSFLRDHLVMSAIFLAVGRALQRVIADGSERRRIHGRYVLAWAIGGYVVGGVVAPFMGADMPLGASGCAGFCLLAGWLIGTLHGAAALTLRRTPPESDPSQSP